MAMSATAIDDALGEVDQLRKVLKKNPALQVKSAEERALVKATAMAWFNKHRGGLIELSGDPAYESADAAYKALLEGSARDLRRTTYDDVLKDLRKILISLRAQGVTGLKAATATTDSPPSFAPLVPDPRMQGVLEARWTECIACLGAQAPLAAIVMMGGLLEALLLARINSEADKKKVFKAATAPKDKAGVTKTLNDWTLKNYIDVVHELGWISVSAKDVGEVLRDYRNYVHPFKQVSHGVDLQMDDSNLLWEVSKAITRQVLKSSAP